MMNIKKCIECPFGNEKLTEQKVQNQNVATVQL